MHGVLVIGYVTFDAIDTQGVGCLLEQMRDELIPRTYVPLKALQHEFPKDREKVRVRSILAVRIVRYSVR